MIHVDELLCLGDVKAMFKFANRFFFRNGKGRSVAPKFLPSDAFLSTCCR